MCSSDLCAELGVGGGAVVVIDVPTGAVRALVGSPDYTSPRAGQVNGALAPRAAGSTLKPFAYALALDQGRLAPSTLLPDAPIHYRDLVPLNFSRDFRGTVPARDALVLSLNLPFVQLLSRVGVERFGNALRSLGLARTGGDDASYGLGMAIGNVEVTLVELVGAYRRLAAGDVFDLGDKLLMVVTDRISAYDFVLQVISEASASSSLLNTGTNAAVRAPSPNSRRAMLGIAKARAKALCS